MDENKVTRQVYSASEVAEAATKVYQAVIIPLVDIATELGCTPDEAILLLVQGYQQSK